MKFFVPIINSETILTKIDAAAGASLSSYHHLLCLSKVAKLFVPSKVEKEIAPNIYGITLPGRSIMDLRDWFFKQNFDGIYMTSSREFDLFRQVAEVPTVMRLPSVRGYHGRMLDGILRCYSLMREYDRICPKSKWGKEFLSKYISNPSALYPIPNGVDSELFAPIEKSFPSVAGFELCSSVILEGMACGLPMILMGLRNL